MHWRMDSRGYWHLDEYIGQAAAVRVLASVYPHGDVWGVNVHKDGEIVAQTTQPSLDEAKSWAVVTYKLNKGN